MSDLAAILFPDDAPVQHVPAEQQISNPTLTLPGQPVKVEADAGKAAPPAGKDDAASTLFPTDRQHFNETEAESFFNTQAGNAVKDGDSERAGDIQTAKEVLLADAKDAGMSHADFNEALGIVSERLGVLELPTQEAIAAEKVSSLETLRNDGVTDSDISAAHRLIVDLDAKSPGLMDTLARSGAGNDVRLIKRAIAEAKRRGY